MAGCPFGSDFGLGLGSRDDVIPDGMYKGRANGIVEIWYGSDLYHQASSENENAGTFLNGAVVTDSGQELRIGDVEDVHFGSFTVSRKVYDVQIGDWAYQVSYDVTAQWNSAPMAGRQFITFSGNADGSITMFDTLELTSLVEYDGGAWAIHANTSGTLYPVQESENPSDGLSNPILELKSGKAAIGDSTTP
jgi:hypothetical protein